MTKRSFFRRRRATPSNAAYHAYREDARRERSRLWAKKPTAAGMARIKDSRSVQQAKADRRSAAWTGARS